MAASTRLTDVMFGTQQMIERPWGVCVFGLGHLESPPEVATIVFRVQRLEGDAQQALQSVTKAVAAVHEVLSRHGVLDRSEGSRLSLRTEFVWRDGRQHFAGYEGEARYSVRTSDLDDVQSLLVDLVRAGAHRIEQVTYDVADKPAMRARARAAAIDAALAKAQAYAAAAGVRLGPVLHVEDRNPDTLTETMSRGHGVGGQPEAADLAPGQVVVQAGVVVGYGLRPP